MELVAKEGVESVTLQGKYKDEVVVVGEDLDSVCLTMRLRKKFGYANILTIEECVQTVPSLRKPSITNNGTDPSVSGRPSPTCTAVPECVKVCVCVQCPVPPPPPYIPSSSMMVCKFEDNYCTIA
ncbi:hypothetical protein ZOSMA_317G00010 [Zostera marina]|uniref:HMA domain-containing protein n=1 Tax=Zostera marina TaxID=29655 RepID=A0A0K9PBK9_ZOSMR|nr:hypothetical protein ZOSMA_317G00010 [Zostera marina]